MSLLDIRSEGHSLYQGKGREGKGREGEGKGREERRRDWPPF